MSKNEKKEKSEKSKEGTINLNDYILIPKVVTIEKKKAPKCMEVWSQETPMSAEYRQIVGDLGVIAAYIANVLNTGPEVDENIAKRCASLSAVLKIIITNTFLDSYHRAGILYEILQELFFKNKLREGLVPLLRTLSLLGTEQQPKKKEDGRGYIQ